MRFVIIAVTCLILVGCQTRSFPPDLNSYLESEYLPQREGTNNYKAFVAAIGTGNYGGYSARKGSGFNLEATVSRLLNQCEKSRKQYSVRTSCKVTHLGNSQIQYSSQMELDSLIKAYVMRVDAKDRESQEAEVSADVTEIPRYILCARATRTNKNFTKSWNNERPEYIEEAQKRGLTCGI